MENDLHVELKPEEIIGGLKLANSFLFAKLFSTLKFSHVQYDNNNNSGNQWKIVHKSFKFLISFSSNISFSY